MDRTADEAAAVRGAADRLLGELDGMGHSARMRSLARWARQSGPAEAGAVVRELDRRRAYERRLAAVAAAVAGDAGFLEGRLADRNGAVRAVALVSALAARRGWTAELRAHLRTLRAHPGPEVRAAALDAATAPE